MMSQVAPLAPMTTASVSEATVPKTIIDIFLEAIKTKQEQGIHENFDQVIKSGNLKEAAPHLKEYFPSCLDAVLDASLSVDTQRQIAIFLRKTMTEFLITQDKELNLSISTDSELRTIYQRFLNRVQESKPADSILAFELYMCVSLFGTPLEELDDDWQKRFETIMAYSGLTFQMTQETPLLVCQLYQQQISSKLFRKNFAKKKEELEEKCIKLEKEIQQLSAQKVTLSATQALANLSVEWEIASQEKNQVEQVFKKKDGSWKVLSIVKLESFSADAIHAALDYLSKCMQEMSHSSRKRKNENELDPSKKRARNDAEKPLTDRQKKGLEYFNQAMDLQENGVLRVKGTFGRKKDFLLTAIRHDPNLASAYFELGRSLLPGDSVMLDGKMMQSKELFIKAIELDTALSEAYLYLGKLLTSTQCIPVLGTFLTQKSALLRAIALNPSLAEAYYELAKTEDEVHLHQGQKMTRQALLIKAIELKPSLVEAYLKLGNSLNAESKVTVNGQRITKQALFLKAIEEIPSCAHAYVQLGLVLPRGETVTVNDQQMTRQGLFFKAIQLDPSLYEAYTYLGDTLSPGDEVILNGERMTQQTLYLKAIESGVDWYPPAPSPYSRLANTLPKRGEIIVNGKRMTQQQLYIEDTKHTRLGEPYFYLGKSLAIGEVVLSTGEFVLSDRDRNIYTQESLFLRAIQMNPSAAAPYSQLGAVLPLGGEIVLDNGQKMTKRELYLKAISLNPRLAEPYSHLALLLNDTESVELSHGEKMNRQDLLLRAIECNPTLAVAYSNLGATLPTEGEIILKNGQKMNQHALFLKAIALDPSLGSAHLNLGSILSIRGDKDGQLFRDKGIELCFKEIERSPLSDQAYLNHFKRDFLIEGALLLNEGQALTWNGFCRKVIELNPALGKAYFYLGIHLPNHSRQVERQDLFLKALARDPSLAPAYCYLGVTLSKREKMTLDGKEMDRKALFLKAITLDPSLGVAYFYLGTTLAEKEKVVLNQGQKMNQQALFIKALELNPCLMMAYWKLGASVKEGFGIEFMENTWTEESLCRAVTHLAPLLGKAHLKLFNARFKVAANPQSLFGANPRSGFVNNQIYLLKAIELDPHLASAYYALGCRMTLNSIKLNNGQTMTRKEIFQKVIALKPTFADAYHALGNILSSEDQVTVNGQRMSKQDLYRKGRELQSSSSKE